MSLQRRLKGGCGSGADLVDLDFSCHHLCHAMPLAPAAGSDMNSSVECYLSGRAARAVEELCSTSFPRLPCHASCNVVGIELQIQVEMDFGGMTGRAIMHSCVMQGA